LRLTLKIKILIQLGLVITSVFVIFTLVVLSIYRSDYLEAVKFRSSALASLVKKKAEDQISSLGGGLSGLGILTLDLKRIVETNENVTQAFIFGPDGKILSHNDISKVNTLVPQHFLDETLGDSKAAIVKDEDSYITLVPIFSRGQKTAAFIAIGFPASVIQEKTWSIIWKFFFLFMLALGVSFAAGSMFVLREIVQPLSRINTIAGEVAGGNLTLEAEARGDELGTLSGSFNNMTQSLRGILQKIKEVASKLAEVAKMMFHQSQKIQRGSIVQSESLQEASKKIEGLTSSVQEIEGMVDSLSGLSQDASSSILEMTSSIQEVEASTLKLRETGEGISTSIGQIAASLKEVAQNVESLRENADETVSSISEINMVIKQVETNTGESARISQECAAVAEEGMRSVTKTAEGMSNIRNAVQETSRIINALGERSAQIGEILTVISQVVDQTNLLALNAAIIATQAGEYGKGFSVVAQEIRNLAERTATSTQDIARLIEAVQTETARAISSVDTGLKIVAEGEELTSHAGNILEKIGKSSKRALTMAEHIAKATQEQAGASSRVTEASERISHSIRQIAKATKDQASGSDLIQQSAELLKQFSLQVHRATAEQAKGSRQISKMAEEVNSSIQKIDKVTHKHRKESEQVLQAIKQNLSLIEENLNAVKGTMGVVDELVELAAVFTEEVSRFTL